MSPAAMTARRPDADAMTDMDLRRAIGDEVLVGRGFEIGAGLVPSRFAGVTDLVVIDKRDAADFEGLFGQAPDYEIVDFGTALARGAGEADFLTAHHVLEHSPDPIGTLAGWVRLLREGGCVYLSVPASYNVCERLREAAPISHLLMDYLNRADGTDFESRQHIPSFINQWTALDPSFFWFAKEGVQTYAHYSLIEQARVEGHDLHWHAFDLDTFKQVMEAAFYVAGIGLVWGETLETEESIFCVAYRSAGPPRRPAFVSAFLDRLRQRLDGGFPA